MRKFFPLLFNNNTRCSLDTIPSSTYCVGITYLFIVLNKRTYLFFFHEKTRREFIRLRNALACAYTLHSQYKSARVVRNLLERG